MNRTPDVQLVLREWLGESHDIAPDRVLEVVADRIARQPQRRTWRLRGRPFMNTYAKLAAGVAAVLIVGRVGWRLLPGLGASGSQATPAPTPTTLTSQSPAFTFVPPLPNGSVAPATYRLSPLGSDRPLRIDAAVPAGWQGYDSWGILGPNGTGTPAGIGIGIIIAEGIYSDPCHWDAAGDGSWPQPGLAVGPTVDDLVNALVASHAYTSTTPADVTLGGFHGKRLTLQLPADISGCDQPSVDTEGRYEVFSGPDAGLYAQGPSNRMQVNIIDVAGVRLIAILGDYAGTSQANHDAAQGILDSFVIMP